MQGVVREGGLVVVHGELWRASAREPLWRGSASRSTGSTG